MLSILPRPLTPAPFEEHYGLTQQPFGLTLDQRFVYPSRSYTTVLNEVRRALQRREGLVVVTGEIGTGKTMLCRTLLQQLDTPVCVSIVLDPRVTVDDLLLHVLTDFGVIRARPPYGNAAAGALTRRQLMRLLQQVLASLIPLGAHAVLVIDEAQHLDPRVLEQLRLLLNLETEEAKLLQIVLIGQPDLGRMLRRPDMRQLDQRVARWCELEPLAGPEVKRYIERRLSIAQRLTVAADIGPLQRENVTVDVPSCNVSFTPSAIRAVAAQSRGIPRLVNLLCDRALEIGYERRTHTIDARIVRAAARRLPGRAFTVPPVRAAAKTVASMAAMVLLAAGLGTWTWTGSHHSVPVLPSPPAEFVAGSASDPRVLTRKPAEVKALAVADSFNVRVASFRAESMAAALAAQLEAAGLPAFTWRLQDAEWHQVIVGPYVSDAEATAVRQRLAAYGHPDSQVFIDYAERPDDQHDDRDTPGAVVAQLFQP